MRTNDINVGCVGCLKERVSGHPLMQTGKKIVKSDRCELEKQLPAMTIEIVFYGGFGTYNFWPIRTRQKTSGLLPAKK